MGRSGSIFIEVGGEEGGIGDRGKEITVEM